MYYFSQLLLEVLDEENANKYIQLEPLCTNPNLYKYLRRLEPKSDDGNDLWDVSKWEGVFLLDPTIPKDQEEITQKFNVTRDRKESIDEQEEDMEKTAHTKYFNLLYLCKTI